MPVGGDDLGYADRLAILLIANGRRDEARRKVSEGRSLLRAYLGRN